MFKYNGCPLAKGGFGVFWNILVGGVCYMLSFMPYSFLKSLLIGWRADSVPCVLYMGPGMFVGGSIV